VITNGKSCLVVSGNRGSGSGSRGSGSESRGSGPARPPGLRGRQIGLWYAAQNKKRRAEAERNSVCCSKFTYIYPKFPRYRKRIIWLK